MPGRPELECAVERGAQRRGDRGPGRTGSRRAPGAISTWFLRLARSFLSRIAVDPSGLAFLWSYARPYSRGLFGTMLLAVPAALLGGASAATVKAVTDAIARGGPPGEVALWISLALLCAIALSILRVLNKSLQTSLHARQSNDMRLQVYLALRRRPLAFHTRASVGDLSNLLVQDVEHAAAGILLVAAAAWHHPLFIAGLLVAMFALDPLLSLTALVVFPLLVLAISRIGRWSRQSEFRCMEQQGRISALLVESLANVREEKVRGLDRERLERHEREGGKLVRWRTRATFQQSLASPVCEILVALMVGGMAVTAWFQLRAGEAEPGDLAGCMTAALWLSRPAKRLAQAIVQLQRSMAATRRIAWAMGAPGRGPGRVRRVSGPIRELTLESVSFSYDGERNLLRGINLRVVRGERIAFWGASGAGKTTLVDLITGFYPTTGGRILVDGVDLERLDLDTWRALIGVVSQEAALFDGTVEENIRHGFPGATRDEVVAAASAAGCEDFLCRLPLGLGSRVGERGCLLSGGERKRVALARALVRPISLLILDEATSELDLRTEGDVLDRLDRLAPSLITIHVSHRGSVLDHADRVFHLRGGEGRETSPGEARLHLLAPQPLGARADG